MNQHELVHQLARLAADAEGLARRIRALQRQLEGREEESPSPEKGTADGGGGEVSSPLMEWLNRHNVHIIRVEQVDDPAWEALDKVVRRMGDIYGSSLPLREFLAALRRAQGDGRPISMNLAGAPPEDISWVTNIATDLHRLALLSAYRYRKERKHLTATLARNPWVINFITGAWFERYVYLRVTQVLNNTVGEYDALRNVQVRLPSGYDAELDLLFLPRGWRHPIWIEAKTGSYQEYVSRYAQLRYQLGIPASQSILVILGLAQDLAERLSRIHPLTVTGEEGIDEIVRQVVEDNAG